MDACCDEHYQRQRNARSMLIAAFGMPGPFSVKGFATIQALVRRKLGDHASVTTDSLDGLIAAMEEQPDGPILLLSHYPQPALAAFLRDHAAGRVVFLEPTNDAVGHLMQTTQQTDMAIIRAVSASCACLASLPNMGPATLIHSHGMETFAATKAVRRIADAAGFRQLTEDDALEAADEASSGFSAASVLAPTCSTPSHLAYDVLAPFDHLFIDGVGPSFSWPQESFLLADTPGVPVRDPVDLTGAARCVIYGPYLHVPVGNWTARIALGFDDYVYDQSFSLELHGAGLLGRVRANAPDRSGLFATEFGFTVTEPHVPLEVRILTEHGAIEGVIDQITVSIFQ